MSTANQETRKLAAYIKDMGYDHFDAHTIDITKMCILDFMGVAIAGSAKKESSIWKEYYAEKVTAPQASLFQPGFQNMTAEQATALNAVFGHVMDMDDVHNASITHLAVITVPTAFALAQKLHLSGKQVIEADIPMSELYGYNTDLRSMTGGIGVYSYEFSRYEQAPGDVQKREVEARAAEAEKD
ncbi:MAG: MmgE/PrpD family protein [Clostridium sp.]|nr:MmgE/PrpD family protein [Clostridium sp.]